MYQNLKILFTSPYRLVSYLILVVLSGILWKETTDISIMFGNYGNLHTYTDIGLSVIMILTFPLFLVAIVYKSWKYGKRADMIGKTNTGIVGGTIATIISGSSCCGATLAASFGLLPLMSILPYNGLEIKLVAVAGLLYALYELLGNLETCKLQIKNKT